MSWRGNVKGVVNATLPGQVVSPFFDIAQGLKLGAIVNLSNPKGIAFFVGLYAVAIPIDASLPTRIAVLMGGIVLELTWYSFVALVLSRRAPQKYYQKAQFIVDKVIGTFLIVVGGKMLANK